MKKALPLIILFALLAGAAAWYLTGKKAILGGAQLLPGSTLFYATIPDVSRSGARWRDTALGKIAADDAVKAFAEKPLEMLAGLGGSEASEIWEKVDPRSLFIAVPAATTESVEVLLGFQFGGTKDDLDEAMGRLHGEAEKAFPVATTAVTDYEGDEITALTTESGTLYSASHESWGFLSSTVETLQAALDRVAGRVTESSLEDDDQFRSVLERLSAEPELLWFVRVKPILERVIEFGEQGAIDTSSLETEQLRQVEAVGGTLTFDGLDQDETLFVLAPDLETEYPTLAHDGMKFTTPETVVYFDAIQDWSAMGDPDYAASLPEDARAFLDSAGIDLTQVADWFGEEATIVLNWPVNSMFPSALAALAISDRPAIESAVDQLSAQAEVELTSSELDGARVFALPAMQIQLVDPVVAISDQYVLGALTKADAAKALAPVDGAETLVDAPGFAGAQAAFATPAQGFGYIDAKVFFERLYGQLRPVAMFAAAMSPDLGQTVDVSKLPETEDIAQYLRPITYLQRQVESGWLMESSGPITMSQSALLGGVGVTAALFSQMQATPPTP